MATDMTHNMTDSHAEVVVVGLVPALSGGHLVVQQGSLPGPLPRAVAWLPVGCCISDPRVGDVLQELLKVLKVLLPSGVALMGWELVYHVQLPHAEVFDGHPVVHHLL